MKIILQPGDVKTEKKPPEAERGIELLKEQQRMTGPGAGPGPYFRWTRDARRQEANALVRPAYAKMIEDEWIIHDSMQDTQERWEKEEPYPFVTRPSLERLKETAQEASGINNIPPIRDYSDPDYQKIATLYCKTTNEKHNVAHFLKNKIFPALPDADKNDLTLLVIGGAGDGRLCKKILGPTIEFETSVRQFFSNAILIDRSPEAIKLTRDYLNGKFHRVTKDQMQRFGGRWSATEAYHEIDQRILPGHRAEKMPLHYEIIRADFPHDKKSTQRTGDVVLLNYMLTYNLYSQWERIVKAAYEQVNPGGVLVIPMHGLNYSEDRSRSIKSIGLFLNLIGGLTYDIDAVADDIKAVLGPKNAEFSFHLIEGSNLVSDRRFAENLVKFASLDYSPNIERIEQHPNQFRAFIDAQQVMLEVGGSVSELYDIAQQSKIIIAHKPQGRPANPQGGWPHENAVPQEGRPSGMENAPKTSLAALQETSRLNGWNSLSLIEMLDNKNPAALQFLKECMGWGKNILTNPEDIWAYVRRT